jgi:hypothetical protein
MGKAVIYFFLNADKKDKKRFDILFKVCTAIRLLWEKNLAIFLFRQPQKPPVLGRNTLSAQGPAPIKRPAP